MSLKARNEEDSSGKKMWTPLELAEMKTGRRIGPIHQAPGFSSRRRIFGEDGVGCYHVMSRVVGGEFLLGDLEKEAFRRMMWRMAEFCGVEILTYALMDNHFHILLKVPQRQKWLRRFEGEEGEEKLLTHLSVMYSKAFMKQLRGEITSLREQERESDIKEILDRFKRRFCDVSRFMKELKERFSRWYNKLHGRRGTLWMDRFKSVLVENGEALRKMTAYIDLNPVRAGLVEDPAQSQWTGYGEAQRGSRRARRGLCKVLGVAQDSWEEKGASLYRCWLYDEGVSVGEEDSMSGERRVPKRKGFTVRQMARVKEEEGKTLEKNHFWRNRVGVFSGGVALGSEHFVEEVAAKHQKLLGRKFQKKAKMVQQEKGEKGRRIFSLRE